MENMSVWRKDLLTGCYPREYLIPYLEKLKIESSVMLKPFSIMMVDLDHFKPMNDKYGHSCGDDVIRYFAGSLRLYLEGESASLVVHNPIFRYGGDEFLVVFPDKKSHEAAKIANKILKVGMKGSRQFIYHGRTFKITFSGGIATYPTDERLIEELMGKADKAMYFSKKHGKSRISTYSTLALENAKSIIGGGLTLVAILFSLFLIFLSFKGVIKDFVFVDRIIKISIPRPERLKNIYLKTGAVVQGVIINEDDPMQVKMIMDTGEGMMTLNKSEIEKITAIEN